MSILSLFKKPGQEERPKPMKIFKAYDIRGIYPSELNEEMAYKIGRAYVEFINRPNIVVGRDGRLCGPVLHDALIKGMTDQGATVTDIGLCTTPMLYFAVWKHKMDGGIMITASHNPKEYNGFKMCKKGVVPLNFEEGIGQIAEAVISDDFKDVAKKGSVKDMNIMDDYLRFIMQFAENIPKLKIVVDAGNGMASVDAPKMFAKLPQLTVVPMYMDIDLSFPNHPANPIEPENLKDIQKRVIKERADLGIAFDGDCDRVFFIDEKGMVVSPDILTTMIATDMLKKSPGQKIGYDLRSTMALREEVVKNKGKPIETRVGHSYIKAQMRKEGISFTGELSGHFYYKENSFAESSLITILKILCILGKEKKPLSELAKPIRRYSHSGELNFTVKDKEHVIEKLEELHKDGKISKLDGIKVTYPDYWFSVRMSNTEPLLRLVLEARDNPKMVMMVEAIRNEIRDIEKSY